MIPPTHLGPEARKAWLEARLAPLEKLPGHAERKRKDLIKAVARQLDSEAPAQQHIQGVSE